MPSTCWHLTSNMHVAILRTTGATMHMSQPGLDPNCCLNLPCSKSGCQNIPQWSSLALAMNCSFQILVTRHLTPKAIQHWLHFIDQIQRLQGHQKLLFLHIKSRAVVPIIMPGLLWGSYESRRPMTECILCHDFCQLNMTISPLQVEQTITWMGVSLSYTIPKTVGEVRWRTRQCTKYQGVLIKQLSPLLMIH